MSKYPKKNGEFNVSKQTSIDNRLNALSLHLGYLFDRGVNFKDRIITWSAEIEHPMFTVIDAAITEMERDSRKTITLRLNSPGGDTYEALAVVGRLRRTKCKIVTEGFGHIMSAATLILACGDERRFSKYGVFMHHESTYGIEGKHSEVKDLAEQMEREELQWAKNMEVFSKKSAKFWLKEGTRKDAYFTAEQLLEFGVIDEII